VLTALLARHGLNVVHVSTVAEAVRRGTELQPQVIVLDLDLPDGVGTEAIKELRRRRGVSGSSHAGVVVYTATDLVSDVVAELSLPGEPNTTVCLTKARVAPWELESHVLRLMDEVAGKSEKEQRELDEGVTRVGA
jgi:CheY-like chemotaxis protein